MTPDGIIFTYAGTGVNGYTGEGGPALQAEIENAGKMAIGATGTLYFTDGIDSVVRHPGPPPSLGDPVDTQPTKPCDRVVPNIFKLSR